MHSDLCDFPLRERQGIEMNFPWLVLICPRFTDFHGGGGRNAQLLDLFVAGDV